MNNKTRQAQENHEKYYAQLMQVMRTLTNETESKLAQNDGRAEKLRLYARASSKTFRKLEYAKLFDKSCWASKGAMDSAQIEYLTRAK